MVILDETFAPPKIAKTGFFPVSSTFFIESTSLESKCPEYLLFLKNLAIIVVEACALCAVPKASLI